MHRHSTAMFCNSFPCNPQPFRTALAEHLIAGGSITDSTAKRILHVITAIIRGQLVRIDLAANAELHHQHLARLPGRLTPQGVLDAMLREIEHNNGTDDIKRQWWTSIASLILFAYGDEGRLDLCDEWARLHDEWKLENSNLQAA